MTTQTFKNLAAALMLACGVITAGAQMPAEIEPVKAPFDMPKLVRPVFPDRSVSIANTGARQGRLSTEAIQKAIDRLAKKGGGTVIVPAGKWLTGRITLRSNINLRIVEGAELHFSGDIKDYLPVVLTRNAGVDLYSTGAMIYACDAVNIAVTGGGKLIAPEYSCELASRMETNISDTVGLMPLSKRIFSGADGGRIFGPVFFGPVSCKNVLVEGVTFLRSVFWNIVPSYCENIIIRGVTVSSHGHGCTDGIDIDSSVNTLIEYTTLDCGDDCFTLKSGRGADGVNRARPTENVVIRHCTAKRGVGGLAVGSETAGMVRNVYMHDCIMDGPQFPIYIKSRRTRGGGGENIRVERILVKSCKTVLNCDMLGSSRYVGAMAKRHPAQPVGRLTPMFRNIFIKDVTVEKCKKLIRAKGLPEQPIENMTIENLKAPSMDIQMQDVGKITFK